MRVCLGIKGWDSFFLRDQPVAEPVGIAAWTALGGGSRKLLLVWMGGIRPLEAGAGLVRGRRSAADGIAADNRFDDVTFCLTGDTGDVILTSVRSLCEESSIL